RTGSAGSDRRVHVPPPPEDRWPRSDPVPGWPAWFATARSGLREVAPQRRGRHALPARGHLTIPQQTFRQFGSNTASALSFLALRVVELFPCFLLRGRSFCGGETAVHSAGMAIVPGTRCDSRSTGKSLGPGSTRR